MDQDVPTILVIEDEEGIQSVIDETLTDAGFSPAIAPSGEEAITLLNGCGERYKALVTDVGLRGRIDGWEVARRARRINPELPVVYITGAHADQWGSEGVPNSILLQKPFAPAQLVTAVSQLLNSATPTT